jgi:hypothetical protein
MKRFLVMLLVVVLPVALMACANESSQEATATTAEPAPAAAAAAPEASPAPRRAAPAPAPAAKPDVVPPTLKAAAPRVYEVPTGTTITVILTDALSSASNKAGDSFTASLASPIVVNGETIAERGATVRGRVVSAEGAGRVKGTANMSLMLTSIVSGSKSYPMTTRPFVTEAEATKGRDAGIIGGGGGVGAAIGAITGGKKGAATGAIIGGAAGTAAVLATKGKEVEFDSESKLTFALDKQAELPKIR